jgi:hypothetical protein
MIPLILAAVGGYLVYDSVKEQYAKGGKVKKMYAVLRSPMGEIIADIEVESEDKAEALRKFREMGINVVGSISFTNNPPHYYADGGTTDEKYNSYEHFIEDNIGSKKYVVVHGSGGATQPFSGATKESIEKQFKELIYGEFMDGEFYYNYASNYDIKKEYLSFIKEYYNSLLESPKKFASFWKNNMTKSNNYDSLYTIKDKYENIVDNYNYSTGNKRIDSKSKYVLAIKNSIGQTIKYEPIEKPESYETYIFSEYKNKMSSKLKEEYIDYRKKYAGEDIKL